MKHTSCAGKAETRVAVVVSANAEWEVVCDRFPGVERRPSPLGDWFTTKVDVGRSQQLVLFFHGGWGKIAAACSTQYVIDRWSPALVVNLGTCGGFEGGIEKGTVVLAERTIVYDIVEKMGDPAAAVAHYTTDIDLSWLACPYPQEVHRALLVSGDRDLLEEDIPRLGSLYGAVAGDWESGAIAYVAARNNTRVLILRGVTDLVGPSGGEAYGNIQLFHRNTRRVMDRLLGFLPAWIACVSSSVLDESC